MVHIILAILRIIGIILLIVLGIAAALILLVRISDSSSERGSAV